MTNDELESSVSSSLKYRLEVLSDECNKMDGRWHKTVFELSSKRTDRLPISDIAIYDIGDKEFGIELGPICFR